MLFSSPGNTKGVVAAVRSPKDVSLAYFPPLAAYPSPSPEALLLPLDAELVAGFGNGLPVDPPAAQTAPALMCSGVPQRVRASTQSEMRARTR